MNDLKRSPILYMGNKYRLIKKGLIDLFPPDINTFVDVFAGSATVSINTKAKNFIVNDIDETLHQYYHLLGSLNANDIIYHIENRITQYKLPRKTTIRCLTHNKQEIEYYKQSYTKLRNEYNKNRDILDLYTLMFFAFSQQFRTNSKGKFNMPFGNNCFSQSNKKAIMEGVGFFKKTNIKYYKKDFKELVLGLKLQQDDFVYLDPPYSITTAVYNENTLWNEKQEKKLFEVCDYLKKQNVKFGLSNTFCNKNILNNELITFCNDNHLNVYSPINFNYHACGKENLNQKEVYICNYKVFQCQNFSDVKL